MFFVFVLTTISVDELALLICNQTSFFHLARLRPCVSHILIKLSLPDSLRSFLNQKERTVSILFKVSITIDVIYVTYTSWWRPPQ